MTKLEFADKLEAYYKKQTINKWLFLILGVVFIVLVFTPSLALAFDDKFGFGSGSLSFLVGLCLGKAWHIQRGSEEHELLVNALDLIANKEDK
ncbi:MAG: hypothetical protein ACI92O_003043 [Colwellia sp.]|jgi:hypothetical protein|tara:strand:- start:1177 stop:1455 length:279 start_codon:yes stop_codon:yes gene_type:complete